jgi:glycolate oxidase
MPTVKLLQKRLLRLLGPEVVRVDQATIEANSGDRWFAAHNPDAVVFPRDTNETSRLLKFAFENNVPVTARGGGVGYVGSCVPSQGGIALSMVKMNRIKEIHVADSVAVVEPGVITGDVQTAARRLNLFYPPDPASLAECSIGGNIATNAGGPRCLKYGVTRNYVLGLEVVLANGAILRTGGRTHKNKTGFDLIGLFVGSEGLLGVVTEATLRLLPLPPARSTISASFPQLAGAARAVQDLFTAGFLPAALEIADELTVQSARKHLVNSTLPAGSAHLLVDLDGQLSSVKSETKSVVSFLKKSGALKIRTALGETACEELWALRRAFSASLKSTGMIKLNEDVVVPRSRLVDLVEFAGKLQKKYGFPIACFGHAGDGNIHVNIMAQDYHRDSKTRAKVDRALDDLFVQVLAWNGVITGEHGIGLAKKPWWRQATSKTSREVHIAIKTALDPRGILNPGKFVEARTKQRKSAT